MSRYFVAKTPIPLFNRPDFPQILHQTPLPLDEKGLFRPLEMIALPGTKFQLLTSLTPEVASMQTDDYPHGPVYLDPRSLQEVAAETPERTKQLPPSPLILARLEEMVGLPYSWGGNWSRGVRGVPLPHGVDCSGLLYEATEGFTPRNTSQLIRFGKPVDLSTDSLQPLDLIVWMGHVIIVRTLATTIESLHGKGVVVQPLQERLASIAPHIQFVIRRFI